MTRTAPTGPPRRPRKSRLRNEKPELTRSGLQVGDRLMEMVFNMPAEVRACASHVEQTSIDTLLCGTCA